ncbi:MAG: hypothetical protein U0Q16_15720 [Bryobacteraceae bacterium]
MGSKCRTSCCRSTSPAARKGGGRNDFLGRVHKGKTLRSFGVNPGGYVGFFNPETGDHETFAMKGDKRAARIIRIKAKAQATRRGERHKAKTLGLGRRSARSLARRRPE